MFLNFRVIKMNFHGKYILQESQFKLGLVLPIFLGQSFYLVDYLFHSFSNDF